MQNPETETDANTGRGQISDDGGDRGQATIERDMPSRLFDLEGSGRDEPGGVCGERFEARNAMSNGSECTAACSVTTRTAANCGAASTGGRIMIDKKTAFRILSSIVGTDRIEDSQRGCFLGLAIGDALGAPIEFQPPGSFRPIADYRSGGPHGLLDGEWTDDTAMALALADSIANAGWDLNDQARRYVSWWRDGKYSVKNCCFDIGFTTRAALRRFESSADAFTSGDTSGRASGNGSVMRLAPVIIRFVHSSYDTLARLSAESSLPTHASLQCLSACRYLAIVLAGLMRARS